MATGVQSGVMQGSVHLDLCLSDQREWFRNQQRCVHLIPGEEWYVLSLEWWNKWKRFISLESVDSRGDQVRMSLRPGPVSNLSIITESGDMKEDLEQDIHYKLLTKVQWDQLVSWYGLNAGESPIIRKVIEIGLYGKLCREVEVYLMKIFLCLYGREEFRVSKEFSKTDTIRKIKDEARVTFNIPSDVVIRIWKLQNSNSCDNFSEYNSDDDNFWAYYSGVESGDVVVIETQNQHGNWPIDELDDSTTSASGLRNNQISDGNLTVKQQHNQPEDTGLEEALKMSTLENEKLQLEQTLNAELERGGSSEHIEWLMCKLDSLQIQLNAMHMDMMFDNESVAESGMLDGNNQSASATSSHSQEENLIECHLQCSICSELFVKATTINCSHTFCCHCLSQWRSKSAECPLCRRKITSAISSLVIDGLIEDMVSRLPSDQKERRKCMVEERENRHPK